MGQRIDWVRPRGRMGSFNLAMCQDIDAIHAEQEAEGIPVDIPVIRSAGRDQSQANHAPSMTRRTVRARLVILSGFIMNSRIPISLASPPSIEAE